jgi:hypothetical protein
MAFWVSFIIPTQGFFNALIYFHSRKQPRQSTLEQTRSSSEFAPPFRQWGSLRFLFSRKRTAASADPITSVVARVVQEEELHDLEEEKPVVEQIDRNNGATEGSRIL